MAPLSWRVLPLLAVGASCLRLDPADEANATTGRRVVSKRHRTGNEVPRAPNGRSYIYIAGVPGTGLDYWKGALRRCTDSKRCEPRELEFYGGMLYGEESAVNEAWVKKDNHHSDRIIPMNLVSPDVDKQPDDVFYRAFANKIIGTEEPRLPLYSKLAQSHGDSLKVVVLTRDSAKELVAYSKRKFKLNESRADDAVAAEIRTLASQVQELPVDSYRCMRFEDTVNLGMNLKPLVKLGDFRTKALALKLRLKSTKDRYGCRYSSKELECPEVKVSAPKTRAALDELEELCDPEDFITTKDDNGLSISSAKKIQWLLE